MAGINPSFNNFNRPLNGNLNKTNTKANQLGQANSQYNLGSLNGPKGDSVSFSTKKATINQQQDEPKQPTKNNEELKGKLVFKSLKWAANKIKEVIVWSGIEEGIKKLFGDDEQPQPQPQPQPDPSKK